MSRTTLVAAATAAVLGSLTLTASAEAGGLRLGFGGPMASFIATPTHGGGGYDAPSSYGRGAHCAKKNSASYNVASRPSAAHQDKVEVAGVRRAPPKTKVMVADARPATEKVAEKISGASETASDADSNGLTGSKALAQTDNAATTAAANEAAKTDAVAVAEAPDTAVETTTAPEVKASEPAAKDVGCKKFIPSVGVTIDVGCEK